MSKIYALILVLLSTIQASASALSIKEFFELSRPDFALATTDFDRTSIIREWVYENTNFAAPNNQYWYEEPNWSGVLTTGTLADMLQPHLSLASGDMCYHLSKILNKMYNEYGYETSYSGWFASHSGFGHSYSLVKIQHQGVWIWQLQDPTYDHALTLNGGPIDWIEALRYLNTGAYIGLEFTAGEARARRILIDPSEVATYATLDYLVSLNHEGVAPDGALVYRTHRKFADDDAISIGDNYRVFLAGEGWPEQSIFMLLNALNAPTAAMHNETFKLRVP